MKKRTKIIIIVVAAVVVLAGVFTALYFIPVRQIYSRFLYIPHEQGVFGQSDDPAISALGSAYEALPELVRCDTEGERTRWFLCSPDFFMRLESVPIEFLDENGQSEGYDDSWQLALDMRPFWEAGLNERYWRTGFFFKRPPRVAALDSTFHGNPFTADGFGIYGIARGEQPEPTPSP